MDLPAEAVQQEAQKVPNLFPLIKSQPYRIAIIGDAPGEDELHQREPFVGSSGRFLNMWLSRTGIVRTACFLGNICQVRPPKNDIKSFAFDGSEIQDGLAQLKKDLDTFQPNICLLLGRAALYSAMGTYAISDWRGSLFIGDRGPFLGRKCIASFHPSACLRQYDCTPLLILDIIRAKDEALSPILVLPNRDLDVNLTFSQTCERLDDILLRKCKVAADIEGGVSNVSCISFATAADKAFIVPFTKLNGDSYWCVDEEAVLWGKVAKVLGDPDITKIFQNGLYDRFVLQYAHNLVVRGAREDIMLKFWEVYCELEKSLGFQCSVLTREPYYKFERKADTSEIFYRYCCKDSAVTFEIESKLESYLSPKQKDHYHSNILALNAFLYMELRGFRYDAEEAKRRLEGIKGHIHREQSKLDTFARQHGLLAQVDWTKPKSDLLTFLQSTCCYKNDRTRPKKNFEEKGYWECYHILTDNPDLPLTPEEQGQIATLCKATMNTKSFSMFQDFLYTTLALPIQWKRDPKTKEMRPTTDYEALLKLSKKHNHPALICGLELSRLRTRAQYLSVYSLNGRMHCSYNLVGSETGRVTCSKSMIYANPKSRVGLNMQTVSDDWDLGDEDHPLTQGLRDLYLADPGCYIAKMDLKGADGWTIGAYMKMLGDSTMLDDLLYGLKPAQIVAYILKHGYGTVAGVDRKSLKGLVSEIKKEDWEYFVSKQGIWGTCLTEDHEVLTPTGWQKINLCSPETPIVVWNGVNGNLNFQVPNAKIQLNFSGTLLSLEGNSYSLLCTPDHRIPFYTNNKLKVCTASEIVSRRGGDLPMSGSWQGTKFEPHARLIAAIMSAGHYTQHGQLTFTFRKVRKIERIKALLAQLGIEFTQHDNFSKRDQVVETTIRCHPGPKHSKKTGAWMLEWDWQSIHDFIDEYPNWDGTTSEASNTTTLFSVDKEHLDWIATLCRLSNQGYTYTGVYESGKGSMVHRLNLNIRQRANLNSMEKTQLEVNNIPVYCFSVSTGYFLVRRNNKIMITGNCYTMGARKLSEIVFLQSEGAVNLPEAEAKHFQAAIFKRYGGVRLMHEYFQRFLNKQSYPPRVMASNGFERKFWNRPQESLGEILAHLPQVYTTHATVVAARRLWTDPENRIALPDSNGYGKCKLRIEPMHQVHDELVSQFRIEDTEWACKKLQSYFNNPVQIANETLVIPYDGAYGTNWSMSGEAKKGTL